ncbi:hypothetical protein V6N13_058604 [Hibiscus sabdariffa]|uniref:Uncharacterized protein n=1 Tax=Hibiscus sabdariffa TaxID=183260 RepID=A0ABR2GHH4_9ROSI
MRPLECEDMPPLEPEDMPPLELEDIVVLLIFIFFSAAMIIMLGISNFAKEKLPWFADDRYLFFCLLPGFIMYLIFFLWPRFPRNIAGLFGMWGFVFRSFTEVGQSMFSAWFLSRLDHWKVMENKLVVVFLLAVVVTICANKLMMPAFQCPHPIIFIDFTFTLVFSIKSGHVWKRALIYGVLCFLLMIIRNFMSYLNHHMGNARLAQAIVALAGVRGVPTAATGGAPTAVTGVAPTSATGVGTRGATTPDSEGVAIEAATGDVARGAAPAAARDSADGSGSARGNDSPGLYYTHAPDFSVNEEFNPLVAAARDSADGSGSARGNDSPGLYYTPAPDFSVNEEFNPLVAAARDSADGSGSARDHAVLDIEMAINEESPLLYYTDDHDLSVGEEFDPLEMV